jgi:Ca-activated chloride channel family protein
MLWGEPQLLRLLWLVPVLVLAAGWGIASRRRRLGRYAESPLWSRLAPARSGGMRGVRIALALLALAFALIAAARPQVGARLVQVDRRGIDVIAVLDVSLSMEATDVVPSRLDRAKEEIRELADGLRGNRLGVVLFSGSSFLLCPLTLDAAAVNLFLDATTVDALPDPGTNLEAALRGALDALQRGGSDGGGRAVVLFTDGEGHEGDVTAAAKALAEARIPVLAVGVGTPNGQPIPMFDPASGRLTGYKKDRSGNVVLSRLDEGTLRQIAEATGGRYFPATLQGREVHEMLDVLGRIERGELGGGMRRRVEERYQVPAGIAAVFLFLALAVPEGSRRGKGSVAGAPSVSSGENAR